MEYWIDGYNLILRKGWDQDAPLEQARAKLLRMVLPLGSVLRVYFDARNGDGRKRDESPSTKVKAIYVSNMAADDAIANDLRLAPRGTITVVTDDRELRGRAKQLGASTVGVEKFLEKIDLANSPVRDPPPATRAPGPEPTAREVRDFRLSKREVDDWMKIFGLEDGGGGPKSP